MTITEIAKTRRQPHGARTVGKNVSIPAELLEAARVEANRQGRTLSWLMVEALRLYLLVRREAA